MSEEDILLAILKEKARLLTEKLAKMPRDEFLMKMFVMVFADALRISNFLIENNGKNFPKKLELSLLRIGGIAKIFEEVDVSKATPFVMADIFRHGMEEILSQQEKSDQS